MFFSSYCNGIPGLANYEIGLVWFGPAWFCFGLVWLGLVWLGLVWFVLARLGSVRFVLVWLGLVWLRGRARAHAGARGRGLRLTTSNPGFQAIGSWA